MKSSIEIIKEMIHWFEKYQDENPKHEASIESFILWLNSKLFSGDEPGESSGYSDLADMELAFLLVMQNRWYKGYAKKVLGDSELSSPDGFSFLYHLSLAGSYRKMELIKMHLLEPPSGIEVLKRLFKKGLLEEFADTEDKRAKRIKIIEKGKVELQRIMPKMKEVFQLMSADFSLNEKLHVIGFLKQMNDFHSENIAKN